VTRDTQMRLNSHERECAIRYDTIQEKLKGLDKRLWRLEAMIMGSTIMIITLAITVFVSIP